MAQTPIISSTKAWLKKQVSHSALNLSKENTLSLVMGNLELAMTAQTMK